MKSETRPDPLALLARANPVTRDERADDPIASARKERVLAHALELIRTAEATPRPGRILTRTRASIAAVVVVVLVLPALAFSGVAGSLFSLGNQGTSVSTTDLDLNDAAQLSRDGVDIGAGIKLLATRDGTAFYASRTADGRTCLLTGPAGGPAPTTIAIATPCVRDFPSAAHPIFNETFFGITAAAPNKPAGPQIVVSLRGLAADGIAEVEAVDADGAVTLEAPVVDNVYSSRITSSVSSFTSPDTRIVALDASGNVVYSSNIPQRQTGSSGS